MLKINIKTKTFENVTVKIEIIDDFTKIFAVHLIAVDRPPDLSEKESMEELHKIIENVLLRANCIIGDCNIVLNGKSSVTDIDMLTGNGFILSLYIR